MLIFPLSTTCVERFFSEMKLVKIQLRNQLSQVNLENLLFIATEASHIIWEWCLKHSLLAYIWLPEIMYPVKKTLLICLNIFLDNTIIVAICDSVLQITFLNKKLNKLCDVMRNLFFLEERFISMLLCSQKNSLELHILLIYPLLKSFLRIYIEPWNLSFYFQHLFILKSVIDKVLLQCSEFLFFLIIYELTAVVSIHSNVFIQQHWLWKCYM